MFRTYLYPKDPSLQLSNENDTLFVGNTVANVMT